MIIEYTSDDRPLVTDFDPMTGRPLVNVVTGEPVAIEAAPEAPADAAADAPAVEEVAVEAPLSGEAAPASQGEAAQ